jgi:hypothetical protein
LVDHHFQVVRRDHLKSNCQSVAVTAAEIIITAKGGNEMVKMVKYCDVCDTFKEWLAKNGHHFNRKYKIRHYVKRESLRIYFEDVTPELHCYVSEGNIGTFVQFKGRCWDLLEDFDYGIRRGRNRKYYCGICRDRERKYYDTPQELLIEHSFENFLEWVNDHFTPFHVLELRQYQGMTSARIIDTREADSKHTAEREASGEILLKLRKVAPGSPPAFKNLDKMKIAFIPVIKGKGSAS